MHNCIIYLTLWVALGCGGGAFDGMIGAASAILPPFGLRVRQGEIDVAQILFVADVAHQNRLARCIAGVAVEDVEGERYAKS